MSELVSCLGVCSAAAGSRRQIGYNCRWRASTPTRVSRAMQACHLLTRIVALRNRVSALPWSSRGRG